MSLVPIDVAGDVAHDEVIDFTLDRSPSAIHIEFITDDDPDLNTGDWAVVYGGVDAANENGRFSYRFRDSTRDGNTWHIAPPGGSWNGIKFRLWADEPSALIGAGLSAIYEVDFTSLATQNLNAAGAHVIDGLTWYAKCTLGNQVTGIVNGSGFRLGLTGGAAAPFSTGAVDYNYRAYFLPFANVPGYDPALDLLVRFKAERAGVSVNSVAAIVGITSTVNDGAVHLAANRQHDHVINLYGSSGSPPYLKRASGSASAYYNAHQSMNVSYGENDHEWGIYSLLAGRATLEVVGDPTWAGSFCDPEDLEFAYAGTSSNGISPFKVAAARSNPGVFFAMAGQVTTTPIHLTHLQIMQPGGGA